MVGPYRLGALLGSGGMAEVYRAFDTGLNRTVALKLLHPHLARDEEFRERFRRESQVAARLREPHVIPIHSFGTIGGRLFLDMRLVEGADLRTVLARRGRLAVARSVSVVCQLAGAIDAAHAEGLVHRDVKPSNVLLATPDGDTAADFVYLVDFGIAQSLIPAAGGSLTASGAAVGTVAYMAPERFAGSPAGASTDIYALACLLHECLTGARPFDHEEVSAQMQAHLRQEPPRPSWRGVPVAFDAVIARGMAKNPADRFGTAGELAAAARAALGAATLPPRAAAPQAADGPTTPVRPRQATRPDGPLPAPGPRRRRRTWIAAAAGLLVAAAAIVAVLLLRPDSRTATAAPIPPAVRTPAPLSGSTTTPLPSSAAPTRSPAAGPSPGEQDLLNHLPAGFSDANCRPTPQRETADITAALACDSGPADGPNRAVLLRYHDPLALTLAFDGIAHDHQILPNFTDPACRDGVTAHGTWEQDHQFRGQLGCYHDNGGYHLFWSDTSQLILIDAVRTDANSTRLYSWWLTL